MFLFIKESRKHIIYYILIVIFSSTTVCNIDNRETIINNSAQIIDNNSARFSNIFFIWHWDMAAENTALPSQECISF